MSGYERLGGRNFQVPVELVFGICTTYWDIRAASNDVIVPFPLTSAAVCWFAFSVIRCTTCCAILAESRPEMPFTLPVLDGVTVYAPGPNPLSE